MVHALQRYHDPVPAFGAAVEQRGELAAVLVQQLPDRRFDVRGLDGRKARELGFLQQGVGHLTRPVLVIERLF